MPIGISLRESLDNTAPADGSQSRTEVSEASPRAHIYGTVLGRRSTWRKSNSHDQGVQTGISAESSTTDVGDARQARYDAERQEENLVKIVTIHDRIACFTWGWFSLTMSTGGIANVLHAIPYRSDWLNGIGLAFFFLNIIFFLFNCTMISIRFYRDPSAFKTSLANQTESLFAPAAPVSVAMILISVCQYGIPYTGEWLEHTMEIIFWIYGAAAMFISAGIYLILWSTQAFPISTMTPIWVFPAYPLLVAGPLAANFLISISAEGTARINSVAIALYAVSLQGAGFMVSLMIYAAFIYRLMTHKLPEEPLRAGMFVSVGPSGLTISGLVLLGSVSEKIFPKGFMGHQDATWILELIATMSGLWIWCLCIWFFLVSVGAHWEFIFQYKRKSHIPFGLGWYSFIFPNTGLATATLALGKSLSSKPMEIAGTIMAAMLIIVWFIVFGAQIKALVQKKLLWPIGEEFKDLDESR